MKVAQQKPELTDDALSPAVPQGAVEDKRPTVKRRRQQTEKCPPWTDETLSEEEEELSETNESLARLEQQSASGTDMEVRDIHDTCPGCF